MLCITSEIINFEIINFLLSRGTLYTGQKSFTGPGKIGCTASTPLGAIWQISCPRALHIIHYSTPWSGHRINKNKRLIALLVVRLKFTFPASPLHCCGLFVHPSENETPIFKFVSVHYVQHGGSIQFKMQF